MDYNFKKFTKTNSKQINKITVTNSNSFGFPTKFYKDNNINGYKYCSLYFDQEKKAVGIQFHNNKEEQHKFSIIHSKEGFGGSIVATSFFKSNDLDTNKIKGKYDWNIVSTDEVSKLFVIELKENQSDAARTN